MWSIHFLKRTQRNSVETFQEMMLEQLNVVLVSLGCYNKNTTDWNFSQFRSLGSPRSRCWQIWCLVRVRFLVHNQMSSHGRRGKEALWVSFIMKLIPFMRAPPAWPNCQLPSNYLVIPDTIQLDEFQGYTNIQSRADINIQKKYPYLTPYTKHEFKMAYRTKCETPNYKNFIQGIPWRSSGQNSAFSLPRAQVRSLVRGTKIP